MLSAWIACVGFPPPPPLCVHGGLRSTYLYYLYVLILYGLRVMDAHHRFARGVVNSVGTCAVEAIKMRRAGDEGKVGLRSAARHCALLRMFVTSFDRVCSCEDGYIRRFLTTVTLPYCVTLPTMVVTRE